MCHQSSSTLGNGLAWSHIDLDERCSVTLFQHRMFKTLQYTRSFENDPILFVLLWYRVSVFHSRIKFKIAVSWQPQLVDPTRTTVSFTRERKYKKISERDDFCLCETFLREACFARRCVILYKHKLNL